MKNHFSHKGLFGSQTNCFMAHLINPQSLIDIKQLLCFIFNVYTQYCRTLIHYKYTILNRFNILYILISLTAINVAKKKQKYSFSEFNESPYLFTENH